MVAEVVPVERPGTLLALAPGVLRIGAETILHTGAWTASTSARGLLRAARTLGDLAGVLEHGGSRIPESEQARLRRTGSELLRRSRDVWTDESRHPAYDGLLRDVAPDEARILVLLLRDGPQPSVDVLAGGVLGRMQPRVVARELTMIGSRASVRYPDAVPTYLDNLTRLGLVERSPEPLRELIRYQVVEAQPDVLEAKHGVRRATLRRTSLRLTPFGSDFARICLA